jgi:plasmid replication initiation protein
MDEKLKRKLVMNKQELEEKRQFGRDWYAGILLDMSGTKTQKRRVSKSKTVRVSNDLINSGFSFCLSEMGTNVLFYSLTRIDLKDTKLFPLEMDLNLFHETLPARRTALSTQIKKNLEELRTLKVELILPGKNLLWVNLFSWVAYKDNERRVYYKFNEDLKHWLIQLKNRFTSFNIDNIKGLIGRHSKWIYVLLKAFVGLRERRISVNDLYYCLGIKQDTLFGNFKPHLDKAISQINILSDINCNYELIKTGRKVTDIHFKIKKKPVTPRIENDCRDRYPDSTNCIREFFEDKLGKHDHWENTYRKGAIKVHNFWVENYKGREDISIHVSRNATAFIRHFLIPWLKTEFRKKGPKIQPTWLISKYFESSLNNFIKNELKEYKESPLDQIREKLNIEAQREAKEQKDAEFYNQEFG